MGSKKILPAYNLVFSASGAMTGTTTITSTPSNISNIDNVGLDISWTGTPNGTISILASVTGNAGTYRALTFNPTLTQPAGAAGSYLVSLNQLPYPWIQVSYTNASSTGTLSASITGKDVN